VERKADSNREIFLSGDVAELPDQIHIPCGSESRWLGELGEATRHHARQRII
jgi:hypothetical protein